MGTDTHDFLIAVGILLALVAGPPLVSYLYRRMRGQTAPVPHDNALRLGRATDGEFINAPKPAEGGSSLQRAMAYKHQSNWLHALEELRKALDQAIREKNRTLESAIWLDMGIISGLREKRYGLGIEYLSNGLKVARDTLNRRHEAAILVNLGEVYRLSGDLEKAETTFREVMPLEQRPSVTAKALQGLGQIYRAQHLYDQAQSNYERAVKLVERSTDSHFVCGLMWEFGDLYVEIGSFRRAAEIYQQVIEIAQKMERPAYETGGLRAYGVMLNMMGDHRHAEAVDQTALQFAFRHHLHVEEALITAHLADIFVLRGEFDKAEANYQNALRTLTMQTHEKHLASSIIIDLGWLAYARDDFAGAAAKFEEALHSVKDSEDARRIAVAHGSLGEALIKLNEPKRAAQHLRQAIETVRDMHPYLRAQLMAILGYALVKAGVPLQDSSTRLGRKALSIMAEIEHPAAVASCHEYLGLTYGELGDVEVAIEHLRQSREIYETLESLHQVTRIDEEIAGLQQR